MHSIKTTTQPIAEPLNLAEVKTYLRVDSSDEDDYIVGLVVAAREWCEAHCNRHFVTRTVRVFMDGWPRGDTLEMPRPFDGSTSTVVGYYLQGSTSKTTLASTQYWLDSDSEPGRIVLRDSAEWPTAELRSVNAVEITAVTGYGGEADVPDGVKTAMLQLIGHWYSNREAVVVGTISSRVDMTVRSLLGPHVIPFFG